MDNLLLATLNENMSFSNTSHSAKFTDKQAGKCFIFFNTVCSIKAIYDKNIIKPLPRSSPFNYNDSVTNMQTPDLPNFFFQHYYSNHNLKCNLHCPGR